MPLNSKNKSKPALVRHSESLSQPPSQAAREPSQLQHRNIHLSFRFFPANPHSPVSPRLPHHRSPESKKEYLLPELVDHLIKNESAEVDVLETKDTWFGVTYQEDKETVMRAFKNLTEAGIYPQGLYQ